MRIFLIIFVLCFSTSLAHQGATGVVKKRMENMSAMADANKLLTTVFRGQAEFNQSIIQNAAEIFLKHSGTALTDLYPEDSFSDVSEAKITIWQQWDKFEQYAFDLQNAAAALAEVNGELDFKRKFRDVGRACSGCHRVFRKTE